MANSPKNVTCLECGWVMFTYSRAEAVNAVRRFNEWYDSQRNDVKRLYIDHTIAAYATDEQIDWEKYHSKIENYEHCFGCGGSYKNFRDGGTAEGHTINPIIDRSE